MPENAGIEIPRWHYEVRLRGLGANPPGWIHRSSLDSGLQGPFGAWVLDAVYCERVGTSLRCRPVLISTDSAFCPRHSVRICF